MVVDRVEDCWNARHDGGAPFGDKLQGIVQNEPGHDQDLGGPADREVHNNGHCEDVKERECAKNTFFADFDARCPVFDLLNICRQIGVGEHSAFGRAGCPAGVLEYGNVIVRADFCRLKRFRRHRELILVKDEIATFCPFEVCELFALKQLIEHRLCRREQGRERSNNGPFQNAEREEFIYFVEENF